MEIVCTRYESTLSIVVNSMSIIMPIILSSIVIVQNFIYNKRNEKLQQEIHNRDVRLRKHDDILSIYSVYYEFIDKIYVSRFKDEVRRGNVYFAMNYNYNLIYLRQNILKTLDLASLLLRRSDEELFEIIKERFQLAVKIIDKYLSYIKDNLNITSQKAWDCMSSSYNIQTYNYIELYQNQNALEIFLKICETDETKEIEKLLKQYSELHEYSKFDVYFEKYLGMQELK